MTQDELTQRRWGRFRFRIWDQIQSQARNQVRDRVGEQVWLLLLSQVWGDVREQAKEDNDDAI